MCRIDDLVEKGYYEKYGRGPYGFDCFGICLEVNRRLGKELPDFGRGVECSNKTLIQIQFERSIHEFQSVSKPQPGDILTFWTETPGLVEHLGVSVGHGKFLHCQKKTGISQGRIDSFPWNQQLLGIYRWNPTSK